MQQQLSPLDSRAISSSSCFSPVTNTNNPLKRKPSPEQSESSPEAPSSVDQNKSEYESGRVICSVCRKGISFRDEDTGGFTLKHWDSHRLICGSVAQPGPETVIYTPESTAEALANPPAKRRRAKRTEEERIDYLRSDPYVAQFEAYRVLCASCDKWIRLRPNSTYCSIPWDAHRKSCLSKKLGNKNSDPDVKKFDSDRVLCKVCNKWLSINNNDHGQAIQTWLQHRSACQKTPSVVTSSENEQGNTKHTRASPVNVPPPSPRHLALAATTNHIIGIPSPDRSSEGKIPVGQLVCKQPLPPLYLPPSQSSPPPSNHSPQRDLNPYNFQPVHESRRRNAEQRAATLRSDPLIGHVEANRVFCSLCQKWVQLRQDSSYCAYPWTQHRGKCLARHQRRAQRTAEVEAIKAMSHDDDLQEDELMTDDGERSDDEPESEEGMEESNDGPHGPARENWNGPYERRKIKVDEKLQEPTSDGERRDGFAHRPWNENEQDELDTGGQPVLSNLVYGSMRTRPAGLADLDSLFGRKHFISASIEHLFRTTYEVTDDMTLSSLLVFLNAAVPPDKYEDFDISEVIKAVASFHAAGRLVLEGDIIRRIEA